MLNLYVINPANGIETSSPIGKNANSKPSSALFNEKRSCNPGILDVKVDKINPERKKKTDSVIRSLTNLCSASSSGDKNKIRVKSFHDFIS